MTPEDFISKWKGATLTESQAAQSHFNDLCALLDEPTPTAADPRGEWYCFERGATKTTGGEGWADVWKRGHFGWEYKGKRKDLNAAFVQLQQYAIALENPPLLVVSDMETFILRTNWTNAVSETHTLTLDDLRDPRGRQTLKWALAEPERLRPGRTRQKVTEDAAGTFADLAKRLRARDHDPQIVAHFINRLVFCLFADDVGLLPAGLFDKLLATARKTPDRFPDYAAKLFRAMKTGGELDLTAIDWFNGGLFDDDTALPLNVEDLRILQDVARLDWDEVDPSIFGTLFERGLDPAKRGQWGAHYTDREKIDLIIQPTLIRPLRREWEEAKARIAATLAAAEAPAARARALAEDRKTAEDAATQQDRATAGGRPASAAERVALQARLRKVKADALKAATAAQTARTKAQDAAAAIYHAFVDRLRDFRVLDPACGSGNFLYLALMALKDIEHRAALEAETFGLRRRLPEVGPENLLGIEISPYAAELARVVVWIGNIQWSRRNSMGLAGRPILKPLDTIECRDAVLDGDRMAHWPKADVIVGNPPFIGDKAMIGALGEAYTKRLRAAYAGRVPGAADFVCYWFEKAREQVAEGRATRVGLVATNSIRGGANRRVLDRIVAKGTIYDAWSDEPWALDGAAVRVSLICFEYNAANESSQLNGQQVAAIYPDLTAGKFDLTNARHIAENQLLASSGITKKGAFDVPGDQARFWISQPTNPNGSANSEVLAPWSNGEDITGRPRDMWIINFGERSEAEAAFFSLPFAHVVLHVRPVRASSGSPAERRQWWLLARRAAALFQRLGPFHRFIATPEVSKHRVFAWLPRGVTPDKNLVVISRDDDTTFGILHSRFHEAWSLRLGTSLEDRPRYTPTTTFETFPFPDGLTPNLPAARYADDPRAIRIADAARALTTVRDRWLNPPEWVEEVPDLLPHLPPRRIPRSAEAARQVKARTLTNLYNTRGTPDGAWLDALHAALDRAVAAAYGWPEDIGTDDALARLLALNQARASR